MAPILIVIVLFAVLGGVGLWWRAQGRRRHRALTRIMDDADAMETLLRRTRERMGVMQWTYDLYARALQGGLDPS